MASETKPTRHSTSSPPPPPVSPAALDLQRNRIESGDELAGTPRPPPSQCQHTDLPAGCVEDVRLEGSLSTALLFHTELEEITDSQDRRFGHEFSIHLFTRRNQSVIISAVTHSTLLVALALWMLPQQIGNDMPSMSGSQYQSSIVELTLLSQFMQQGIQAFDAQIKSSNESQQVAAWQRERNKISDTWNQAQTVLASLKEAQASSGKQADSQPGKSIYPGIAAALNMDMVGRMEKQLVLQGIGSSDYWTAEIEKRNAVVGLPIKLNNDTQLPTDASSFYRAGVPILSAFTGSHSDYHTPRDTPEKLNYPDATRIAKLMGLITRGLVISDDIPVYIRQSAQEKRESRGVMRAYLGTVPDYAADETGVLLSDVTAGAPADTAGVKGGDIIVELAGRKIENIYDFTYAIEALKIGQETSIAVLREGKRLDMKVVPGSRE